MKVYFVDSKNQEDDYPSYEGYPYRDLLFLRKESAVQYCDELIQKQATDAMEAYERAVVGYNERLENYNKAKAAEVSGVVQPYPPRLREPAILYCVDSYDVIE